jgi:DNA-binding protein YbaB
VADDIIGELHELRRYAAGLRDSIAQAQATAPQRAEATDGSGTVRVVLGSDGLPESIHVDADWRRRLDAAVFGDAVVEAFQAAVGERLAAWSRSLDGEGLRSRAERLRADSDDQRPIEATDPLPPAMRDAVAGARPRALDVLAEDMMRALDSVGELATASPLVVTGSGSSGSGHLAVTLSKAGLVSCTAQARWVSQQSGSVLTTALGEALAEARADLAAAVEAPDPAHQLDQLFAEALAILTDPQRLAGS